MAGRASLKQYLIVDENGKGHLPVRDTPDGPLNHHLMGAAWAALHGGYRGNSYEGPGKNAAIEKLKALYRAEGMDMPDAKAAGGQMGRPAEGGDSRFRTQDSRTAIDRRPSTITDPGGPRFVMMLSEPPGTGLIRIPIAVTGQWKGAEKEFSIGLDDLKEIRENFASKPTREINVDYEHASEVPFGTGGPVLSAGRIVKLDEPERFQNGSGQMGRSADGEIGSGKSVPSAQLPTSPSAGAAPFAHFILWGWYEPTDRARQLIAAKEYRYISPAIRWGAKDKVTGKTAGTVLTSVALVNKPFLEEMPEIQLCEVDGTRAFVSLGQLHVPAPVNQDSGFRIQDSGLGKSGDRKIGRTEVGESGARSQKSGKTGSSLVPRHSSLLEKEKEMAKILKLKCLTDEHIEKHGLEPELKGKIGVFDGEELIGVADGAEVWEAKHGDGEEVKKLAEVFASEIGLPGMSFVDIAALVKRGIEAPMDQFAALSESIHDGRINLLEAGKLADAGRVSFSTILRAQEAERRVDAAVKAGKVLPKNRAQALKLALSDAAVFNALVDQARPVVDLRSHGHAGGGEQPTAQQALMAEVNAYAKENKCSLSVALSDITKRNPDLWRQYSEEIVTAVEAAEEEEE
ncbi:MAG: phage protease [Terriglobia bacterium]|jgi:hypothetical protein